MSWRVLASVCACMLAVIALAGVGFCVSACHGKQQCLSSTAPVSVQPQVFLIVTWSSAICGVMIPCTCFLTPSSCGTACMVLVGIHSLHTCNMPVAAWETESYILRD